MSLGVKGITNARIQVCVVACTVNIGMVPALTITGFEFDCKVPNLAPGWYDNGVIIDSSDIVPETDETNNVGSSVNPELTQ